MSTPSSQAAPIESDIPARLDVQPWSRWHVRILIALGTSWILDGLEVTLVGSLSGVLQGNAGLSMSNQDVTAAATVYLSGAVLGALLFGHLTDKHGRKRLFLVTLATYSLATLGTGLSVNIPMFMVCRFSPDSASVANTRQSTRQSMRSFPARSAVRWISSSIPLFGSEP